MLLDPPARFLYRHGSNLYGPMRVFATNYCFLCRIGVGFAALSMVYAALAHRLLWFVGIQQLLR